MIKKPHTLINTKSILYTLNIYNVIFVIYIIIKEYIYITFIFLSNFIFCFYKTPRK